MTSENISNFEALTNIGEKLRSLEITYGNTNSDNRFSMIEFEVSINDTNMREQKPLILSKK